MALVMNYSLHSSPTPSTSSPASIPRSNPFKWGILRYQHHHRTFIICTFSRSLRRHHRRRRHPDKPNRPNPTLMSDEKLQMTIDVEDLSNKASMSIQKLLNPSPIKLSKFVNSGAEALEDLLTLVTLDADRRFVVSCRRSTVEFLGVLALCCCVAVFALRVFVKLGLGFLGRFRLGDSDELILRRDRSLGGREVAVGRKKNVSRDFRVLQSPQARARETVSTDSKAKPKTWARRTEVKELPSWWPVSLPPPTVTLHEREYQRMANRLIRAILDNRMSGKDISKDDVIQFRRLCRTSGAKVSIDTTNARDSFYRASVEFVLNICGSTASKSVCVHIDGEPAQQFIAGLADNIQLEKTRAARIVCAAVAARTRLCFLQAWALKMQGKHSDALTELSKICTIHQMFPPKESSPEMEMVAQGLEKHLKLEQRKCLMDMLIGVCGEGSHRSVTEALGLAASWEDLGDQGNHKYSIS